MWQARSRVDATRPWGYTCYNDRALPLRGLRERGKGPAVRHSEGAGPFRFQVG